MKKIIFIDGYMAIVTPIEAGKNGNRNAKKSELTLTAVQALKAAVALRMDTCMKGLEEAIAEGLIHSISESLKEDANGVQRCTNALYYWTNKSGYAHHFSTEAYDAMESLINKLEGTAQNWELFEDHTMLAVFHPGNFTWLEVDQLNKALINYPIESSIKKALLELLVVKVNEQARNTGEYQLAV